MQLYILDTNYDIVGLIDEYESVLWQKKFNDSGECEIYAPLTDDLVSLLQRGFYILRYDDDMFCKINDIQFDNNVEQGDYIICTAQDICKVMFGRIISRQIVFTGKVTDYVELLLNENIINAEESRKIPNFIIDKSNFDEITDSVEDTAYGEDVLQVIVRACKYANLGFRVSYNVVDRVFVFRLYKGKNKASIDGEEYVEFSSRFQNMISSKYRVTDANYKNVACVNYASENSEIKTLYVYIGDEPTGEERREVFVDGTGLSRAITYEELVAMFPNIVKNEQKNTYDAGVGGIAVATFEVESSETITLYPEEVSHEELVELFSKVTYTILKGAFAEIKKKKVQVADFDLVNMPDTYLVSRVVTEEELYEIFPTAEKNGNQYTVQLQHRTIKVATSEYSEKETLTATDYTVRQMLYRLGENALSSQKIEQEFTADVDTVDSYLYKHDYELGDIVMVVTERGLEINAQITSVMESDDTENGYAVEPHFEYK